MSSQDDKNLRDKWILADALAGDACPGDEKEGVAGEAAHRSGSGSDKDISNEEKKRMSIPLLITLGGTLGLGLGISFAMLLVKGELDLSLKEIKTIVQTIKQIVPG